MIQITQGAKTITSSHWLPIRKAQLSPALLYYTPLIYLKLCLCMIYRVNSSPAVDNYNRFQPIKTRYNICVCEYPLKTRCDVCMLLPLK